MAIDFVASYDFIGFCLTAGAAVFAYVRSSDDLRAQNAAIASIIGVVFSIVFGMRFEAAYKIQQELAAADSISRNPSRMHLLEMTSVLQTSEEQRSPLATIVLNAKMRALREQFDQISSGRFVVSEAEMPLFNAQMIRSAKKEIQTTNYIGLSKWWTDPWGEKYEEINESAVKAGIKVTRVFIFKEAGDVPIAADIMERERRSGIQVRLATLSELPPFTGDIILIDGKLVGEHQLVPGKGVSEARFSLNQADVSRVRLDYAVIESNSRSYRP